MSEGKDTLSRCRLLAKRGSRLDSAACACGQKPTFLSLRFVGGACCRSLALPSTPSCSSFRACSGVRQSPTVQAASGKGSEDPHHLTECRGCPWSLLAPSVGSCSPRGSTARRGLAIPFGTWIAASVSISSLHAWLCHPGSIPYLWATARVKGVVKGRTQATGRSLSHTRNDGSSAWLLLFRLQGARRTRP